MAEQARKFKYNPTAGMIVAMVLGVAAGLVWGPAMAEIKFIG